MPAYPHIRECSWQQKSHPLFQAYTNSRCIDSYKIVQDRTVIILCNRPIMIHTGDAYGTKTSYTGAVYNALFAQ